MCRPRPPQSYQHISPRAGLFPGRKPSPPYDRYWPRVTQTPVSAGVVNLCFAIELFLKSILVANGASPEKTHKLVDLFASIPTKDVDLVKTGYEKRFKSPTFDELVKQINNYFVEVRYGYEYSVFSYSETPVYWLAWELYVHAADIHKISQTAAENVHL